MKFKKSSNIYDLLVKIPKKVIKLYDFDFIICMYSQGGSTFIVGGAMAPSDLKKTLYIYLYMYSN